ncbi:MAG: hypothetical protein IKZ42_05390 [Clostridiales bacterium]|nr:hypothetical protein [Clostridiales bacterium]
MNKKELEISYSALRRCALVFISLPMLCFFIGWLKWYFAVPACLALVICIISLDDNNKLLKMLSKKKADVSASPDNDKKLVISRTMLIVVILASFAYLFFCGVGRLWSQSDDYLWRNAIFRDLIIKKWPVFYDTYDGALSYYIGTWLPAAIVGKIAYSMGAGTEPSFMVGNVTLLIYCTFGMSVLFLLLLMYFKTTKPKQAAFIIIGFVFFSGMDFVGNEFKIDSFHIEWWALTFQYSSLTTCLCWVFNQTIIPWVCTALLLHEKTVSNYVLIGMACLFSGPFPFIGFFIFCLAMGIKRLVDMVKEKKGKDFVKEIFSVSNICSVLFIFPIVGSFLLANTMMSKYKSDEPIFLPPTWCFENYILYILFLLFEVLIFAALIAKPNRKNYLFYVMLAQLIIYPIFNVGINSDLTMRSSISAIFMLYVFCYQYMLTNPMISPRNPKAKSKENFESLISRINLLHIVLVVCLLIGAITPGVELARGFGRVYYRGLNDRATDFVITLERDYNPVPYEEKDDWPPTNFVALDYDNTIFFRYFARKKG